MAPVANEMAAEKIVWWRLDTISVLEAGSVLVALIFGERAVVVVAQAALIFGSTLSHLISLHVIVVLVLVLVL